MSKYLASIIDIINHDVSVEKVRSSNDKIIRLMEKARKFNFQQSPPLTPLKIEKRGTPKRLRVFSYDR